MNSTTTATATSTSTATAPLRRSPRLAMKAATVTPKPMSIIAKKKYKRRAKEITPPVSQDTTRTKKPRRNMMTENEFDRFNESLSMEDKEIQANLLMWCIIHSVPYTLALFHQYKHTIQQLMQKGMM
jgi:hypothetical protein